MNDGLAIAAVLVAIASNLLLLGRVRQLDRCRRVLSKQLINTENRLMKVTHRVQVLEMEQIS